MNNPDLQRWLLAPDGIATRLRALRGAATGKDFAAAAGMRPAKLSKLELAQQTPTAADIEAIAAAAGAPVNVSADLVAKLGEMPAVAVSARVNRFGQVATQKRLNQMLAGATTVRLFEPTYLPRPMQTIDYATTVLAGVARTNGVKDESAQAASVLTSSVDLLRDPARTFQIVITEPVLRWQIQPAVAMRAQLERLLELAALPNVDMRVLALDRRTAVPPAAGFGLVDDRGYSDTLEGADELTDERLAGHRRLMDDLLKAAASPAESTELVRTVLAQTMTAGISVRFNSGSPD